VRGNGGDPGPNYSTRTEQTVWKASWKVHITRLIAVMFGLKAWTLETAGWEWIRDFDVSKDERGAWKALNEHYNGSGHVSCRVEYAKAKLEKLHWSNEAVFSYEK